MSDDRQALIDTIDAAFTDPEAILDALLAVPVPLLREIAAATKPCATCRDSGYPGWRDGYQRDGCTACGGGAYRAGSGRVPAVDRAALLAALGYEQVGWTDVDAKHYPRIVFSEQQQPHEVPVWAARVSEETP